MNTGQKIGKLIIAWVWIALLGVSVAVGLEVWLGFRWAAHEEGPSDPSPTPQFDRLLKAYEPFSAHYLHPLYVLFFPLDPAKRRELKNPVCSIDSNGFRGPGPEANPGRKLAFLLGGSAAFGYLAGSNDTTITGYLNRYQEEYWFINAGVPAWTSAQELFRFIHQIIEYKPALVVTYNGFNDLFFMMELCGNPLFPPGTVYPFPQLHLAVSQPEEGLKPFSRLLAKTKEYLLFSNLRAWLERHNPQGKIPFYPLSPSPQKDSAPFRRMPDCVFHKVVPSYIHNLTQMSLTAKANGVRFLALFQPVLWLHENVRPQNQDAEMAKHFKPWKNRALELGRHRFEFHDFSTLFDQSFNPIPVFLPATEDIRGEMIFIDAVHTTDRGNELVAKHIMDLINRSPGDPRSKKQGSTSSPSPHRLDFHHDSLPVLSFLENTGNHE